MAELMVLPEITTLQALRGGLEQVRRGWTQGTYRNGSDDVCAIGGLYAAISLGCGAFLYGPRDRAAAVLTAVIRDQYPEWWAGSPCAHEREPDMTAVVIEWNDHDGRTQAEVVAVFEKAIAQEAERA